MQRVLQQVEDIINGATWERSLLIAKDLANAWLECIGQLVSLPPKEVRKVGAWVAMTEGSLLNLQHMPEKGQKEVSQTVSAVQLQQFKIDVLTSPKEVAWKDTKTG